MTWTREPLPRVRTGRVVARLLLLLGLIAGGPVGCGDLLEVSDPTRILDSDLNNAEGAELLWRDALRQLYGVTGEAAWVSGLLADEFVAQQSVDEDLSGISSPDELLDRRNTTEFYDGGHVAPGYDAWQRLRMQTTATALAKLRAHAPPGAREARAGELFAVRGYAATRLGEDFCPGFPLHEVVDYKMIYGPPRTTAEVFDYALRAFDSALTWAADSARVRDFARVGRGRTLLNLGRFAEAAAAVTEVPTGYVYRTEYNSALFSLTNFLAGEPGWNGWGSARSVANREGGTGLDFVAAQDPRVKADSVGPSRNGAIALYRLGKYPSRTTPIVLASGIEARLIEAEAALRAGDVPTWLAKLNAPRREAWTTIVPAVAGPLPDLADPGTDSARVVLTFRERAFWLFGTGHRLGDLRRLVRHYAQSSESVFPSGAYWRSGVYSSGTSLPFQATEVTFSPGVTGCTGG